MPDIPKPPSGYATWLDLCLDIYSYEQVGEQNARAELAALCAERDALRKSLAWVMGWLDQPFYDYDSPEYIAAKALLESGT